MNSVPCQYPCATYIHTCCSYFKPLDHFLKLSDIGSTITIICPAKATSTLPLQQTFNILRLSPACSVTSRYFHLPQHYKDHTMMMNISWDTANSNAVYISTQDFRIWQHFNDNWTTSYMQKLTNVPEVSVTLVNQFTHLHSTRMMTKNHPLYGQS